MDNSHSTTVYMNSFSPSNSPIFLRPLQQPVFETQLTFIYVCLCLHNINFHPMMWTHIESQVIDINLSRDFLLIYARQQRKKKFKRFHERVDLLTTLFFCLVRDRLSGFFRWIWSLWRRWKRDELRWRTHDWDQVTRFVHTYFCGDWRVDWGVGRKNEGALEK